MNFKYNQEKYWHIRDAVFASSINVATDALINNCLEQIRILEKAIQFRVSEIENEERD